MGNSQSQPSKSTPLGCLLCNLKALGFQEEIRPKRLIYYSNTIWPQYRLDHRSQRPENRTLRDLNNFYHHKGKWLEIPYVQAFFAFHCQPSLSESCSTSQILLAHSGPHPPNTMSPDPCSDFSSSSLDHSSPPIAPNPIAATPGPIPQPPPNVPSSLLPSQVQQLPTPLPSQCLRQALRPQPHPLPWSQGFTPASLDPLSIAGLNNLKTGNFTAGPCSFSFSITPFTGSSWNRAHC